MNRNSRRLTIGLIAMAAVSLSIPENAVAEERQFLVILAHSPKQFGGGFPPGGLTNPQLIDRQYFDSIPNNDIDSFLEYWEEISYGDVRISPSLQRSKTTEWILLPWAVTGAADPAPDPAAVSFTGPEALIIGLTRDAMVATDFGDGSTPSAVGKGSPDSVWMPGERFIDMDGDGFWDALDEANNQMDFFRWCGSDADCTGLIAPIGIPVCDPDRQLCIDRTTGDRILAPDDLPDLFGPWIDLDGDGDGNNDNNCVYLPDSDNDGNPDCCPDGPGMPGCEPFDPVDPSVVACLATTWTDEDGNTIIDCNGNLIDDFIDINGVPGVLPPISEDVSPQTDDGVSCAASPDGIPDECQFINFGSGGPTSGNLPCVDPGEDDQGFCANRELCRPLTPGPRTAQPRCEFDDSNDDGVLDVVEPFENFLRRWDVRSGRWSRFSVPVCQGGVSDTLLCDRGFPDSVCAANPSVCVTETQCIADGGECVGSSADRQYIINNYPGTANLVLLQSRPRPLTGAHGDGTFPSAGQHNQFDSPDFWSEAGNAKMNNPPPGSLPFSTRKPAWYEQAWVDRFGSAPPPWNSFGGSISTALTPRMVRLNSTLARPFQPDQGGLNGRGVGFPDPVADPLILPEEIAGADQPRSYYDGPVEFIDLPSSKYHRVGEGRLGEVTSPFNEDIWGQDRGDHDPGTSFGPDGRIPAAGPYATHIHGNFGRDAGNLLLMELLTWRTDGQSLTGAKKDFNLDGMLDQGVGSGPVTYGDGKTRIMEDCIEILDDIIDFDDFVDTVTLDQVNCLFSPSRVSVPVPPALQGGSPPGELVEPMGLLSGVILLPAGTPTSDTFNRVPQFAVVHNEDSLDAVAPPPTSLPRIQSAPPVPGLPIFRPQIGWNLLVHNWVRSIDDSFVGGGQTEDFQVRDSAHIYLSRWEGFPFLFDFDVFDDGAIVNCPVGVWDIMASGGLVHSVPILKESVCTEWTDPVDLASVLTPGVDTTLTLPPAEFVRDESYYFLENDSRLGERYYFWSAGVERSFDEPRQGGGVPAAGMLVMHTDVGPNSIVGSNAEALSQQQRSGTRPAFLIVQADGDNELQACSAGGNTGDDADPWPGSTAATRFNFGTIPSATWFTQNSWTGIDVLDVVPDDEGSIQLTINWVPTSIPSLRFVDPPGGQSVGDLFQVRFDATDVFGGTEIRVFYTPDQKKCGGAGANCTLDTDCAAGVLCVHDLTMSAGNFVGSLDKVTPGTNQRSISWDFSAVPEGRYVLFAKLNPGPGADGTEAKRTKPRAGRNNVGNGTITVDPVTGVDIDDDAIDTDDSARLETWTVTCIDPAGVKFLVTSSLSQPDSLADPPPTAASASCADAMIACTTASYTSPGGEVTFTLTQGATPFALDDSFTFTTTGITAVSQSFSITDGEISSGPIARIVAAPLSGPPPLEVDFDARLSIEPNGDPLSFRWTFGDGTEPTIGSTVTHAYNVAGTFTVTLRATSTVTGDFGEASVDVVVFNNSPTAVITATPTSGPAPLSVAFNGLGSTDSETTDPADLIYEWVYGDGGTANTQGDPGVQSAKPTHTYSRKVDGSLCTEQAPCTFVAALTVTDELGKKDTATITILVGNSNPVASVTATPVDGPAPLTVEFNAINSTDPDDDDTNSLTVVWNWDDGTPSETHPLKGNVDDSGLVRHIYTNPGSYRPTATIKDGNGGEAVWAGVDILVKANEAPEAKCTVSPSVGVAEDTSFVFNASGSTDPEGEPLTFSWDFKDGTPNGDEALETHEFAEVDNYDVVLTVTDSRNVSDTAICRVTVNTTPDNQAPLALIATGLRICAATCTLGFDGSLSLDPEGTALTHSWVFNLEDVVCQSNASCPIGFRCESQTCVARRTGEKITFQFQTPGSYSVMLTVTDGDGAFDDVGPQEIRVLQSGTIIVAEPEFGLPGNGVDGPPPPSSLQRPRGLCGFGVVTSFVGSLFGLTAMSIARRRNRRRSVSRGG